LKAYQFSTTPTLGDGILHARWFNILVVGFELFFGFWLVFGLLAKLTQFATTMLFFVFAAVSFYKAISGEVSCGCFGAITVNPWITMTGDLVVVAVVLLMFRIKQTVESDSKPLLLPVVSIVFSWLVVAMPLGWLMASFQPATFNSDGELSGISRAVMLYPKEWLGQKCPVLEFTEIAADLKRGRWIVVFYGAECEKCKEHFAEWKTKGFPVAKKGDEQIAMLEIYGKAENIFRQMLNNEPYIWGSLSSSKQWYVETPVVILLVEGIVQVVWTETR
jgi:hypothetical protein